MTHAQVPPDPGRGHRPEGPTASPWREGRGACQGQEPMQGTPRQATPPPERARLPVLPSRSPGGVWAGAVWGRSACSRTRGPNHVSLTPDPTRRPNSTRPQAGWDELPNEHAEVRGRSQRFGSERHACWALPGQLGRRPEGTARSRDKASDSHRALCLGCGLARMGHCRFGGTGAS